MNSNKSKSTTKSKSTNNKKTKSKKTSSNQKKSNNSSSNANASINCDKIPKVLAALISVGFAFLLHFIGVCDDELTVVDATIEYTISSIYTTYIYYEIDFGVTEIDGIYDHYAGYYYAGYLTGFSDEYDDLCDSGIDDACQLQWRGIVWILLNMFALFAGVIAIYGLASQQFRNGKDPKVAEASKYGPIIAPPLIFVAILVWTVANPAEDMYDDGSADLGASIWLSIFAIIFYIVGHWFYRQTQIEK